MGFLKDKFGIGAKQKEESKFNASLGHYFNETYFDGETTPGAIGHVKEYYIDNYTLSARSWQAFIESDAAQLILKQYQKWVIGSGLKLKSDINEIVLESEGIKINTDDVSKLIENRFYIFSNAHAFTHSGECSINDEASSTYKESIISGDCLVILRVVNNNITTQLIEARFLTTPHEEVQAAEKRGNIISGGIEENKKGTHIAYYIQTNNDGSYKRIKAMSGKFRMAFMIYGMKYRSTDNRGIPLFSAALETLAKIDRYKDAVIGSAEERQKIAYAITHDIGSSGANPLQDKINARTVASVDAINGGVNTSNQLVVETTGKQAINLNPGADLKVLETKNELYFESFYTINMRLLCATIGIPMEVAFSWYDSNYSASRAALKSWEHTLKVERKSFSDQYYKRIYALWFHLEVNASKISVPGYMKAWSDGNIMVTESYKACSFLGDNIPHIDPLKEVAAERMKLGGSGVNIPLTTPEKATRNLSEGEYDSNIREYERQFSELEDSIANFSNTPQEIEEKKDTKED